MVAAVERLTTTTVYRASDGGRHYTNYSRFLSRYRWSVQELSQQLLSVLVQHLPRWHDDQGRQRLCLVVDETIVEKSSKRMYGVAWQRNTHGGFCRGTHILGHYWLMLGVLCPVGGRTLCFPLGFRLYRQKKRCPAAEYKTPSELVKELLQSLTWPPGLLRTIVADAGFADGKLMKWCADNGFAIIVRGRIDAEVHDLFVQQPSPLRGRPRKYGAKLSLAAHAQGERNFTHTVHLYQSDTAARVASLTAMHHASGLPIKFVISRCEGKPDTVIMSSDLSLTAREIVHLYADRFAIEMTFRELKQHFGLGHYQVRLPEAMLRHVHLSAVACAVTQLLTLRPPQRGFGEGILRPQRMPWRTKQALVSVHEIQMLLRRACYHAPTFMPVPPTDRHAGKSYTTGATRIAQHQELLN